ncbi:FUSC family protein [Streptomyces aidingensis]|uniref:Aromatic acid exporter family member 1 n=1 Tax=Streptomyces aidingensis TaxID=910347 RepID=A0A1I1SH21_9ACTN|nr:Aromatic acid exporter family member 1 [Streptomyces aidingensis]
MIELASRRKEPVVVQTVRSTAAATLAYLAADQVVEVRAPLLAPLTAILVVQVTVYATLTSGIRRVNSVVAGVSVAAAFSVVVPLTWWSLGLLILSSLVVGHLVRAGEFVPEVAISAMLVLGVTRVTETAVDRVVETLIGAAVGLVMNAVFVPPVWVRPAGEAIEDLAGRMRRLLLHIGEELGGHVPVHRAADKLHQARRLDDDVSEVDSSLSQAEESLKFNPRVKEGLLYRVVLRTGLDTLEICTVVLRSLTRTLTDLARRRTEEELFDADVSRALQVLLGHLAAAVDSFAMLITSQVSTSSEAAEDRLARELAASREGRDRIAWLLLARVREHPRQWQLHGALLAEIDRMLDELDVEKRTMRLAEELDQYGQERPRGRFPRLGRARRRVRSARRRLRGRLRRRRSRSAAPVS